MSQNGDDQFLGKRMDGWQIEPDVSCARQNHPAGTNKL
jgi:hypothetical protein